MTNPQRKRLYQVWKGSNRFFCGGRLIFGPDVASVFLSSVLIAGPTIAFCSRTILNIRQHEHFWIPVLAVAVVITVSDLIFLFLTSGRDPGIVPRNARPPESDEALDFITPSMEWVRGRTPHLSLPRTKDVTVNGIVVKVKFCDTCLLYRPPRASHCSICNNCVQKFDHHCPWVGQCIGLRNYRFFFLFISSSTFLCFYIFAFSWVNIFLHKKGHSLKDTMSKEIVSLVLIIYCFITVWFVGGLTVFHLYLISTNQTTYENFRYRYEKKENPHNRGILKNFKEIFFSSVPPSLNDFRSWVLDDQIDTGLVTSNNEVDMIILKDKAGIETSNSNLGIGASSLPVILQNLDYSDLEDSFKGNDVNDDSAPVPFFFSIDQDALKAKGKTDDSAHIPFFFHIDQELCVTEESCILTPVNHDIGNSNQDSSTDPVNHELGDSDLGYAMLNGVNMDDGNQEGTVLDGITPIDQECNRDNYVLQV